MTSNPPTFNSNRRRDRSRNLSPSQAPVEVIDLTDSPPLAQRRLPNSRPNPPSRHRSFTDQTREVIDLDSLPDPQPPQRTRPPQRPHPNLPSDTFAHDVVTLGDSPPPPPPSSPPTRGLPSFFNLLRTQFLGTPGPVTQTREVTHYHYHIHPATQFTPPGRLNYALNAQHVYGDDTPLRDHPGFKDDAYRAPQPPREGYTRSPKENMALICPQCGDELGKNLDVVKKQVWVAKCGHTYCGSCAASQRHNKQKGVKAGRCIVEGCARIVSGDKAMVEVFL